MIASPVPSWAFIILFVLLPACALLLSGLIVLLGILYSLVWWQRNRGQPHAFVQCFGQSNTWKVILSVLLLLDCWAVFLGYQYQQIDRQVRHELQNKESRRVSQIKQAMPYGKIILPAGSVVHRNDPYDNGDDMYPFKLNYITVVSFPAPMQIHGLWISKMDLSAKRFTLAKDAQLKGTVCTAGHEVIFDIPFPADDNETEVQLWASFNKPEPAGKEANFDPATFKHMQCNVN